jgi:transposase
MATHGTKRELEARRMLAADLFERGVATGEVAAQLGVTPGAVSQWRSLWEEHGKEGLRSKPHPGSKPRLSDDQRDELVGLLLEGPRANGFSTDLWTLPRVADLIDRCFGVSYDPSHVSRILKRLGWSPQKPTKRAREQDEELVSEWRKKDWPRIKKNSQGR